MAKYSAIPRVSVPSASQVYNPHQWQQSFGTSFLQSLQDEIKSVRMAEAKKREQEVKMAQEMVGSEYYKPVTGEGGTITPEQMVGSAGQMKFRRVAPSQEEINSQRQAFANVIRNVDEITQDMVDWGNEIGIRGLKIGKTTKGRQLEEKKLYYKRIVSGKSATDLRALVDDLDKEMKRLAPHAAYYIPNAVKLQYEDMQTRHAAALEELERISGVGKKSQGKTSDTVMVEKDGQQFELPRTQLQEALKEGYREIR